MNVLDCTCVSGRKFLDVGTKVWVQAHAAIHGLCMALLFTVTPHLYRSVAVPQSQVHNITLSLGFRKALGRCVNYESTELDATGPEAPQYNPTTGYCSTYYDRVHLRLVIERLH